MQELVIATLTPSPMIYTFVGSSYNGNPHETAEEALQRVNETRLEDLKKAKDNVLLYDAEYWQRRVEELEQESYSIMTLEDFDKKHDASYLAMPIEEITEEQYEEMFNILPPMRWCTIKGVEMFCMSEMQSGSITNQYARAGDRYYTGYVDILDKSTWLCERLER